MEDIVKNENAFENCASNQLQDEELMDVAPSQDGSEFQLYPNLPPELQMKVVDEMRPDDRCRFRRCSNLSNAKAVSSRNYLYGLELIGWSQRTIIIHYQFDRVWNRFYFEYKSFPDRKYMRYLNSEGTELWRKDASQSTNLIRHAIKNFKNSLLCGQRTIKSLAIRGDFICSKLRNVDFGIERLSRLKTLDIGSMDFQQFVPKTINLSSGLTLSIGANNQLLQNYQQIYQCQKSLTVWDLKLNNAQFLQLSAGSIKIHIGHLTPQDIFNFIQSWKNGEIRKNFKECRWSMVGSDFDIPQLRKLVKISNESRKMDFTQNGDTSKCAQLAFPHHNWMFLYKNCLQFGIVDEDQ